MINKYKKKPVVVEACEYTGTTESVIEIQAFTGYDTLTLKYDKGKETIIIPTLEGEHIASIGDYIIRGINGEFYPCKPDIFKKTYDAVATGHATEHENYPSEE